jgi:hypothetical protein
MATASEAMPGDEDGVHACRRHPTAKWRPRLPGHDVELRAITHRSEQLTCFTQARGGVVADRAGDHIWARPAAAPQAALLPDQSCDHQPGAGTLGELRRIAQCCGAARPALEESQDRTWLRLRSHSTIMALRELAAKVILAS